MNLYKIIFTMFVLIMMLSAIGCAATRIPAPATSPKTTPDPMHTSIEITTETSGYRSRACTVWSADEKSGVETMTADAQSNLVTAVCGINPGKVTSFKTTAAGTMNAMVCAEIKVDRNHLVCYQPPFIENSCREFNLRNPKDR